MHLCSIWHLLSLFAVCSCSLIASNLTRRCINRRGTLLCDSRYLLYVLLNSGAQGQVWKAIDQLSCSPVRIKITPSDQFRGTDSFRLAENEQRVLQRLKSAYSLRHLDWFAESNFYYHVTEFVESITLKEFFQTIVSDSLSVERRFKKVAYLLLEAIHSLHQSGIVHQDIKPTNVIIYDGGERLKLIDFGLSYVYDKEGKNKQNYEINRVAVSEKLKRVNFNMLDNQNNEQIGNATGKTGSTTTDMSLVGGTRPFIPPEVIFGKLNQMGSCHLINPSNDYYAFGVTLYYGYYGELPRTWIHDEDSLYLESKRRFYCPQLEDLIQKLIRFNVKFRLTEYEDIKKHDYFYACYVESST